MKSICTVFVWFLLIVQVYAAVQKLTIYEEPDQKGESYTFQGKYANFLDFERTLMNKTKSYCFVGL